MANGMVAMGNIGHKGVVMASGMMVAMGNVDCGVVVWIMGWWPWECWPWGGGVGNGMMVATGMLDTGW